MASLKRSQCLTPPRDPACPTSQNTRLLVFEEDMHVDLRIRRMGYGEFIKAPAGDILGMERPWTLKERFQSREVDLAHRNAYIRLMGRFHEG